MFRVELIVRKEEVLDQVVIQRTCSLDPFSIFFINSNNIQSVIQQSNHQSCHSSYKPFLLFNLLQQNNSQCFQILEKTASICGLKNGLIQNQLLNIFVNQFLQELENNQVKPSHQMQQINEDKLTSIRQLLRKSQPTEPQTFEEPSVNKTPKFQYLEQSRTDIPDIPETIQVKPQKKRGRPPKSASKDKQMQMQPDEPSVRSFISTNVKGKRKAQLLPVDVDEDEAKSAIFGLKKRGRPRKNPLVNNDNVSEQPKKRGRPRKNPPQEEREQSASSSMDDKPTKSKPFRNELQRPQGSIMKKADKEFKLNKLLKEKKKKMTDNQELTPISIQFRNLIEMEENFSSKLVNENLKVLQIKEKNGKISYLCEEGQTIKWVSSEELSETKLKQLVNFYERRALNEDNLKHSDHICSAPVFIRRE